MAEKTSSPAVETKTKMPTDAKAYAEMFLRPGETVAGQRRDADGKIVVPCPAVTTNKGRQFVMDEAGFAITHGLPAGMVGRLRYVPGSGAGDEKRGIPADHVLEA